MSNAGLISALAYSLFSITITLTNKALLTSYSFDSTLTLTFLQGMVTVLCASLVVCTQSVAASLSSCHCAVAATATTFLALISPSVCRP